MRITAIISVYQNPKRAGDIIQKLLDNEYSNKEVIVIVDGGSNYAIETALEPFQEKITIRYNLSRLGKSSSLNQAVLALSTDIILFLDNDILLPSNPDFLNLLFLEMQKFDIAELPKEAITKSLISKMMGYEFLGFAMTEWVFSKLSGHCPSMNGAAFAVKKQVFQLLDGFKKVVHEDMDFAARAFRSGLRFSYNPKLKVFNEVSMNLKDWLIQRKRWALNNVLWLKNNLLLVVTHFFKSPTFFLSSLFLLLPFMIYIAVFLLMRFTHLTAVLPLLFMTVQQFHMAAGLFLWVSHVDLIFVEGLIPTAVGVVASGSIYFIFSRLLKFRFNPFEYILFYFIYSPIWMLANVIMWAMVIFKINVKLDWKV